MTAKSQNVAQAPREVQRRGAGHDDGDDAHNGPRGRSGEAHRLIGIGIGGAPVSGDMS